MMSKTKKDVRGMALPILTAGAVLLAGVPSASAGEQRLANPDPDAQNPSAEVQSSPSLHTALVRAGHDKEFAKELVQNPEKFRTSFNLSDDQISVIKNSGAYMEGPAMLAGDYNMS